jgi:GntR family transcriptional regulator of arabinose operon
LGRTPPLYLRVKERIRAELVEVAYGNGPVRLPAERHLQARYGVSRPTISKALGELAREGLLIKTPGSAPLVAPLPPPSAWLRAGRRIGYVAPIPGHELTQRSLRGIERAAQRRDYRVIFGNAGQSVESERAALEEMIAAGARGVIISPVTRMRAAAHDDYLLGENLPVPVILIDTGRPEHPHPQLRFDNRQVTYEITQRLLTAGLRRIALLTNREGWLHATLGARRQGYLDAHGDLGLSPDGDLIRQAYPLATERPHDEIPDDLEAILRDWWRRSEPPQAIIAPEDRCAMEVIDRLCGSGIPVPEAVHVVGFDCLDAARRFRPAFPTTGPDFSRMGELACETLIRCLETGEAPPAVQWLHVPFLPDRQVGSDWTPAVPAAIPAA